jgi:hypothetical protein
VQKHPKRNKNEGQREMKKRQGKRQKKKGIFCFHFPPTSLFDKKGILI